MSITTSPLSDGEYAIALGETFDFNCVDEFRRSYESVSASLVSQFSIDFRKTHFMDSSALGMLINMQKHWGDKGVEIRIINANAQVKKLFSISRLDKKFSIE
ncbi:MAG: STAS domain-containing protein [Candidatus Pelagadaptatus aseana]|uniref:STAS domain-containing protein n=1 Tax=Candidatus Pelagadaptatus aseana TaxID=3120508 RepID=UPI0039B2250F